MDFLDNLVGSAKVALQQFLDCTKEDSLKTPDEPMQCTDETSDSTEPSGDTADSTNSNIDSSGAKDESDGRYDECGSPLSDSALEEEPDCDRMMYCWGNTANGELGLGGIEDLHIPLPRELKFTHSNKVKAVSCGSSHTLVLLHNGQLYSCGNNDFGQLGHDKPRTKLQMIEALASYKIIAVSCGENHSLALDQWGQVFSWGGNNHGQLGSHVGEATYMSKPKVVKGLVTSTVVQIACGHWHNLALTNKGELFSWGLNDSGQLGLGLKVPSVPTPSLITSLVGLPISLIACGGFHTFVVSKSGAVYGWGRNRFGQLGLNSELDHIYPSQLKTLRTINVKYIDCGEDFSVFLTQEGGVLSCGAGAYGQLGHGGTANEALPKKIIELMGTAVTQIACGRRHTLTFVESRDKVYAFGLGSSGQLGTKLQVNASVPTVVQGPWLSGKPYIEGIYSGGDHCFALVSSKKKPSDYRACPPDSCIWSIKVEKMIECQKVGENQTVDQDLLTYLETVLASQACINGSFLLPNDRHYCCTTRHHGIDFRNAQACFTAISRSQNSTIKDVCLEALSNIAPNLAASPPDIETLRLYLTLPLYHEFDNARHAFKLQAPFAAALLRLKPEAYKIVGIWYSVSSDEYFERLVRIYKSVVVFMLRNSPGVNREHGIDLNLSDPAIIDCLDVLDRLNKLNNLKPSHMKLNYEIFYMPEILEVVDVRIDFIKWVTDHTNARKFFCNYPFLFDAEAKTMLLQTDQSIQMQTAMNQAVNQTWQQLIFSPVVFPVNAFLELHVSRQNIVDDTIRELSNYSEKDYRKPLKIHFLGEEAEDAGGVRKEFFLLLMTEILDPKYGMFRSDSESNAIWFSEDSFEDETMYYLVGLLCGLAIYNFTIINLPFPLALYKKLLSEPVTLLDLKQLFPSLANIKT